MFVRVGHSGLFNGGVKVSEGTQAVHVFEIQM